MFLSTIRGPITNALFRVSAPIQSRSMAQSVTAPTFKPFNLALIQLGGVSADKAHNLKHAREMILKAASGEGGSKPKPNIIVLPVCM